MANRHVRSAWLTCKSALSCLSPTAASRTNDGLHVPEKIPATVKGPSHRTWDARRCAQNLLHSAIAAGPSVWRAWKRLGPEVAAWAGPAMPAIRDRLQRDSGETPARPQ